MNPQFRDSLFLTVILLGCLLVQAGRGQFLESVIPVGDTPLDVIWNSTSNKVYTSNSQSGSVTVIDGATNEVIRTVAVAEYPVSLCWNSLNNKVYVTCGDPDWLYVIDGVGDTVINRVRMRGWPCTMAYNSTMNKLYVLCSDDRIVRVYDGAGDTLLAEVWFGDLNVPNALLWHPVSNRVFCATAGDAEVDTVFVLDCTTDDIAERLPVGDQPCAMCWNPVNNLLYVDANGGIRVLTATGDSVVAIVAADACDMCFAPYPNKIYAVTSGRTYVIDCDSQAVSESLPYGGFAAVSDTMHGRVYGSIYYTNSLYVFDARTDTLIRAIPLGQYPDRMCWNRANSRVYITDAMDDAVYVVRDTTTGITEPAITLPGQSTLIVASPNPFARAVDIQCGTRLAPGAGVRVFSQAGRFVRRLVSDLTPPGHLATFAWDGKDQLGRRAPKGVYLAVVDGQAGVRAKLVKLD